MRALGLRHQRQGELQDRRRRGDVRDRRRLLRWARPHSRLVCGYRDRRVQPDEGAAADDRRRHEEHGGRRSLSFVSGLSLIPTDEPAVVLVGEAEVSPAKYRAIVSTIRRLVTRYWFDG